jgi:hypothetical protein
MPHVVFITLFWGSKWNLFKWTNKQKAHVLRHSTKLPNAVKRSSLNSTLERKCKAATDSIKRWWEQGPGSLCLRS